MVVNRYSGLAIEGFDPVAYFTDSMAVQGLPDFEAAQAGAVWRFRNEGNRASFVAHPEIYGPQFGGYDPVDLGRGVTYAGNPRFWVVTGQRLYLFGREDNRDAFAAEPARFLKEATRRWPELQEDAGAVASMARANDSKAAGGIAPGDEFRHDEILASQPKCRAAPCRSVTLPPAAVTTAWPAATSHSEVGDRRG